MLIVANPAAQDCVEHINAQIANVAFVSESYHNNFSSTA